MLAKLPEIEKMEESINDTDPQIEQEGGNTEQEVITNTQEEEIEDRGCLDCLLWICSWFKNDGHELQHHNYDPYCFEPDPHYPGFNKD